MKKISIIVVGVLVLLWAGKGLTGKSQMTNDPSVNSGLSKYQSKSQSQITHTSPSPTSHSSLVPRHSLFIPYWSANITETDPKYDSYYYFGIAPTAKGKIENDAGLSNLPKVVNSLQSTVKSRKKLVLRMLDATVTEALLSDEAAQTTLSTEIQSLLNKNAFSGLIIDLEVPFTFQPTKKAQITQFVQQICESLKSDYKTCDLLLYGDFQFRNRPYDLKALGKVTDLILLMAYDFHKAAGEPGPNFPFDSGSQISPSLRASPSNVGYDYSFQQMIADATAFVPKEKIEVVFGMYGYDWTLNEQGMPLKSAEAVSLNEIRNRVAQNANRQNEENATRYTLHENAAKEKSIQYIDADGRSHIIWYEDEESAEVKTKYLQNQGINKVSYWAQGYF